MIHPMNPYPHSMHCPWSCPCQLENGNYFPSLDGGIGTLHTHLVPIQPAQPLLATSTFVLSTPIFPTTIAPSAGPAPPPLGLLDELYPDNSTRKDQLRTVFNSPWYQYGGGDLEPNHELRQFIDEISPEEFKCSACSKVLTRFDRAEDHFRTHINHRPYPCVRNCGVPDCSYRSYTKTTLTAHERKPTKRTTCHRCNKPLDSKNLKRHHLSKTCMSHSSSRTRDTPYSHESVFGSPTYPTPPVLY